jgi:hypothetical protein
MPALDQLQQEATECCERRGHKLGKWNIFHGESRSLANNECTVCGAEVQCNSRPMPNQIEIGGDALALNCPAKRVHF